MKIFLVCALMAYALKAQAPAPPPAQMTPETVIVKVDGRDVTAGEIQRIIDNSSPAFLQQFRADPAVALSAVFVRHELADEADKLKLAEQSPWKEQIEAGRDSVLANAMVTRAINTFSFTPEQEQAEYEKRKSGFEQVRVKLIKIGFKAGAKPAGTSASDLEQAAREALQAAHDPTTRPEAEAKKIADDLVKKLRAGEDFAKLVTEYSDDQETKKSGGDLGFVKPSSPYPEDLKKAAMALKVGQVSDPIRIQLGFYILRAEERTATPFPEVREQIVMQLRQARVDALVGDLQKRFKPTIERPDLINRFIPGKQ
jgi:parvulin-like peptidyl-prolyl isomerase